jgi:hypothetical protein
MQAADSGATDRAFAFGSTSTCRVIDLGGQKPCCKRSFGSCLKRRTGREGPVFGVTQRQSRLAAVPNNHVSRSQGHAFDKCEARLASESVEQWEPVSEEDGTDR